MRKFSSPREEALEIAIQTRKDILEGKRDVVPTVRACLVIARNLNKNDEEKWMRSELSGYSKGEKPRYREVRLQIQDDYGNHLGFHDTSLGHELHYLSAILQTESRSVHIAYKKDSDDVLILQEPIIRSLLNTPRARAKLEPYLGFLHSVQYGKPSLVCDLQELYRYLVDDFVIQFCQGLKERDFTVKSESVSRKRKGKREYLNDAETNRMMKGLEKYFESKIEIPLIRYGKRQRIETLINEETLLLAKYLRNEIQTWAPRLFTHAWVISKIGSDNS